MDRISIPIEQFATRPFHLLDRQWMLLTGGSFMEGKFNAMTISWGALGFLWNRPYLQVVVRPQRYTYAFMEKYGTFTVCAFPEAYHQALSRLGVQSGRDGDKIARSGLTPAASACVEAPGYLEAELIFECRKIYSHDFDPSRFLDPSIDRNYPIQDYHRTYYGEIKAIYGTPSYLAK